MTGLRRTGVCLVIGIAVIALVSASTPKRYRASSTIRFDYTCRVTENFAGKLIDAKLRWPVNDTRSKLLEAEGRNPSITVERLQTTDDRSASVTVSYDSVDAAAAAREAARVAGRFRAVFLSEWQSKPVQPPPLDPSIAQRLSELKSRLLASESTLARWKNSHKSASPPSDLTWEYDRLQKDYVGALRSVEDSHALIDGVPCTWIVSTLDGVPETATVARFLLF